VLGQRPVLQQQQTVDDGDVAAGSDQGHQRVAHGLQDGETGTARTPEQQPVGGVPVAPEQQEHGGRHQQLRELLDEPDEGRGDIADAAHGRVLQRAGHEHTDHPTEQGGEADDRTPNTEGQPTASGDEGDEGDRHHGGPQEDQRRPEQRVAGAVHGQPHSSYSTPPTTRTGSHDHRRNSSIHRVAGRTTVVTSTALIPLTSVPSRASPRARHRG
jgi:hypothetical protein